jgi:hypothetical protein
MNAPFIPENKRPGARLEIERKRDGTFRIAAHDLTWRGIAKGSVIVADPLPDYPAARREFDAVKNGGPK